MKITMLLAILLMTVEAFAYVPILSGDGKEIKWSSSKSSIKLQFSGSNSSGISSSTVGTIVDAAITQWNSASGKSISRTSGSSNISGSISFSSSSAFFTGTGVLGITQVAYDIKTGLAEEAKVVLNDNAFFSATPGDTNYLGDVISHELGHLLGLDHSQVYGATMFFQVRNGQESLSSDDKSGVNHLYSATTSGQIKGKVIGGASRVGIFGAHVQAISVETGEVLSAGVTNTSGEFTLKGLDNTNSYVVYVEPLKNLDAQSTYYGEVKNDFCLGGAAYRGTFFQGCATSAKGHPTVVSLGSSGSVDIGEVTIRCGMDAPETYMEAKNASDFDLSLVSLTHPLPAFGNVYTGYFSTADIAASTPDNINIDVSDVDFSAEFASDLDLGDELYIELRTHSQKFFSSTKISIRVTYPDASSDVFPTSLNFEGVQFDSENNPTLEVLARIPIDLATQANNIFAIEITPDDFEAFVDTTSESYSNYIPAFDIYEDSLNYYALTASLVKKDSNGIFSSVAVKKQAVSDNKSCPDASAAFSVVPTVNTQSISAASSSTSAAAGEDVVACGSIALLASTSGNGPSSGSASPIASLIFLILAPLVIVVTRRRPKLSNFCSATLKN